MVFDSNKFKVVGTVKAWESTDYPSHFENAKKTGINLDSSLLASICNKPENADYLFKVNRWMYGKENSQIVFIEELFVFDANTGRLFFSINKLISDDELGPIEAIHDIENERQKEIGAELVRAFIGSSPQEWADHNQEAIIAGINDYSATTDRRLNVNSRSSILPHICEHVRRKMGQVKDSPFFYGGISDFIDRHFDEEIFREYIDVHNNNLEVRRNEAMEKVADFLSKNAFGGTKSQKSVTIESAITELKIPANLIRKADYDNLISLIEEKMIEKGEN